MGENVVCIFCGKKIEDTDKDGALNKRVVWGLEYKGKKVTVTRDLELFNEGGKQIQGCLTCQDGILSGIQKYVDEKTT